MPLVPQVVLMVQVGQWICIQLIQVPRMLQTAASITAGFIVTGSPRAVRLVALVSISTKQPLTPPITMVPVPQVGTRRLMLTSFLPVMIGLGGARQVTELQSVAMLLPR